MNLTVNGQSQVPPGFRFHPTEEELLQYYLKKKVANEKIDLDVIQDVDLNKLEPWDIQEKCKIGSSIQNDWYIFSHKDKKYPTGTRTNRATRTGFWKATGRDKVIRSSSRRIGMRKTLVFYKGRAPHGEKSEWIMHEYRLDDNNINDNDHVHNESEATKDGWVICRVFKKKNYFKALDIDQKSCTYSVKTPDMKEILSYMEKTNTTTTITSMDQSVQEQFLHLPQLESPTDHIIDPLTFDQDVRISNNSSHLGHQTSILNWAQLDQLVAYQLNGEASDSSRRLSCLDSNTSPSINHFNALPFCLNDGNGGSDEHTVSPLDDELYWSTSPLMDSIHYLPV